MECRGNKAVVGDLQNDCPESQELADSGFTSTVFILDQEGEVLDMVDFTSRFEAEEYAEFWNRENGG